MLVQPCSLFVLFVLLQCGGLKGQAPAALV